MTHTVSYEALVTQAQGALVWDPESFPWVCHSPIETRGYSTTHSYSRDGSHIVYVDHMVDEGQRIASISGLSWLLAGLLDESFSNVRQFTDPHMSS